MRYRFNVFFFVLFYLTNVDTYSFEVAAQFSFLKDGEMMAVGEARFCGASARSFDRNEVRIC